MSFRSPILILLVPLLVAACATQQHLPGDPQLQLSYIDADGFTDFKKDWSTRERDQQLLMDQLERELERVSRRLLHEGQRLELEFTDIDMAGEIRPTADARTDRIRIVESIYPPRLEFNYRLLGTDGQVLDAGSEVLRDTLSDASLTRAHGRHSPLAFEVVMLERWLDRKLDTVSGS